jgi:hypothetical protein
VAGGRDGKSTSSLKYHCCFSRGAMKITVDRHDQRQKLSPHSAAFDGMAALRRAFWQQRNARQSHEKANTIFSLTAK